MKVLSKIEIQAMKKKRESALTVLRPEMEAFVNSGAEFAELDANYYSETYASQVFMRLSKQPEFRGKVAVHLSHHRIIAERL